MFLGDNKFRSNTKRPIDVQNRKRRKLNKSDKEGNLVRCNDNEMRVSYSVFVEAKKPPAPRSNRANPIKPRLCGNDLSLLKEHLLSYEKTSGRLCEICGNICYWRCGICNKCTCFKQDNAVTTILCCLDFHDDHYFGLARCDRQTIFGETTKKFKKPSATKIRKNKSHIEDLNKRMIREELG